MKTIVFTALFVCAFSQNSSAAEAGLAKIIVNFKRPVMVGNVDLFYHNETIAFVSGDGEMQTKVEFIINDKRFEKCLNFENNKKYLKANANGWPSSVHSFECLFL